MMQYIASLLIVTSWRKVDIEQADALHRNGNALLRRSQRSPTTFTGENASALDIKEVPF
ncbi:hypothetical protein QA646_24710 (plasmid) [Rhizobium sp. CB3090]|uniref:hypothetical protein n=1 Tax=Rhizobium sp. CB3090 TaxID=3039156 RepID=UPI0024B15C5E|nr:hypothetical protein [Rhizobium sp. CB3090]WFU11594.1 hypothetical protein QA646_24710 [Rhizobium sp. CB3090]